MHWQATFVHRAIPPLLFQMSKLLTSIAVGAAAGIAVGAVAHFAAERQDAGKPFIPSALSGALSGLAPLGARLKEDLMENLPIILAAAQKHFAGQEEGEQSADQEQPGQPLETATTPPATGGHPAGPDFAPTPA